MKQLYLLGSILCLLCACAKDNIPTENSEGAVRYKSIATIDGVPFALEAGKDGYAVGTSVEINPSNGFNIYTGQLYQANGGADKGTIKLEFFDDTIRTTGNAHINQLLQNHSVPAILPTPSQEDFAFSLRGYQGRCRWEMYGALTYNPNPTMTVVGGVGHTSVCVTVTSWNGTQNTLCNDINIDTTQRRCRMHGFRYRIFTGPDSISKVARIELQDQGWQIEQISFGDGTSLNNVGAPYVDHSYESTGTFRVSILASYQNCLERFAKDIVIDYPSIPSIDYVWDSRVTFFNNVPGHRYRYRLTYRSPSGAVYKSPMTSYLTNPIPRTFNIAQSIQSPGRANAWLIALDDIDLPLYEDVTHQSVRFRSTDLKMAIGTN